MTFLPDQDFDFEITKGKVAGHAQRIAFGANEAVSSTAVDIWPLATDYPFQSSAFVPTVVSTSALDTLAGTGARIIRLIGLNSTFNEITEDVNLNGVTPVAAVNSFTRIQRAFVLAAGSLEFAQGTVDVLAGAAIVGRLLGVASAPAPNHTRQAVFTVPAGKTGIIRRLFGGVTGAADASIQVHIRPPGGAFAAQIEAQVAGQFLVTDTLSLGPIPSQSDIKMRTAKIGGGTPVRVKGGFTIILVDNSLL